MSKLLIQDDFKTISEIENYYNTLTNDFLEKLNTLKIESIKEHIGFINEYQSVFKLFSKNLNRRLCKLEEKGYEDKMFRFLISNVNEITKLNMLLIVFYIRNDLRLSDDDINVYKFTIHDGLNMYNYYKTNLLEENER